MCNITKFLSFLRQIAKKIDVTNVTENQDQKVDSKEELLLKHQAHYGEKERNIHKRKPNKILKNCVLTGKRDAS